MGVTSCRPSPPEGRARRPTTRGLARRTNVALPFMSALATIAPREIPRAAGRLRHFLRASFDQHERELVPLGEELAVVRAYLDIESLQLGNRLKVEETIDPGLSEALVPPFSLQPLVENAVQHGLQSSATAGRLRLAVHMAGEWLEMSVSDDGVWELMCSFGAMTKCSSTIAALPAGIETSCGETSFTQLAVFVGPGTEAVGIV